MKWPWRKRKKGGVKTRVINAPSETIARLYAPGEPDIKPRYHVSPVTDSWAFRLVERHGKYYPVFPGFFNALLRVVYTVEGTAEPIDDELLTKYPLRVYDQGESIYDWEWPIPWPYRPVKRPPCWHPWFRAPPHDTGETKTIEVSHKDGTKSVSTEPIIEKGKLHFSVLHEAKVEIPALGKDTSEEIIDHANGWEEKGERAALAEVATNRAIRAEQTAKVEGTRQTLAAYAERFTKEAQKGTITKQIQDDLAKLSKDADAESGEAKDEPED